MPEVETSVWPRDNISPVIDGPSTVRVHTLSMCPSPGRPQIASHADTTLNEQRPERTDTAILGHARFSVNEAFCHN